eukprot:7402016-Alexandrium_andersonii.AAC.1
MEPGMDLLSDLLGPLEGPLQDDSLVHSSERDSPVRSAQRHVISRSTPATSHAHAIVSDHLQGGRSGVEDRSPPTAPSWTPSASTAAPLARRP